jgi:hypothetical protein
MSYTKIASFTASGGETDTFFNTIPTTYKHLAIQGFVRSNIATTDMVVQFNGITTTSSYCFAQANTNINNSWNNVSHYAPSDTDGIRLADYIPNSGSDWCGFSSYITDYQSTAKWKNVISLSNNAYIANQWIAGSVLTTAAVTSIRVRMSGTFIAGSKIVLYGLS